MKRRSFLGSFAAFAAGMVLDPEQLLWVPGKKVISIPTLHGGVLPALFGIGGTVHIPGICKGDMAEYALQRSQTAQSTLSINSKADTLYERREGGDSFIRRMMGVKEFYRLATASEVQKAIETGFDPDSSIHICT